MLPGTEHTNRGVTLLELILVVLLLSLLSVYAATRWDSGATTIGSQGDFLAANIRHIQNLAMVQGQTLTLDIDSVNSRYDVRDSSTAIITNPVTGMPFTVFLDNGATIAGTDTQFNSFGTPVNAGVPLPGNRVFTLNSGGTNSTVTVQPVSGFVTVAP